MSSEISGNITDETLWYSYLVRLLPQREYRRDMTLSGTMLRSYIVTHWTPVCSMHPYLTTISPMRLLTNSTPTLCTYYAFPNAFISR